MSSPDRPPGPAPDLPPGSPERVSPRRVVALVVLGTVLLFGYLGSYRTLGSHEVFVAVPAREMLASGDWIVPRYGEIPRLQKPPLAYWIVATAGLVTGEVSELTARLPSAFSACLLACLVGAWARRWYGPTAGWAAALIQLTSVWVITYGRKAEVDVLLCLLTTAALATFALAPRELSPRRWFVRWIGIYSLIAVAWLAKFHFGAAMVIGPVVLFLAWQRRFRELLHLLNPAGLVLLSLAALAWPLSVLRSLPGAVETWQAETIGRAMGQSGFVPPWYYLGPLLLLTLPWTPWLIAGMRSSWTRARKEGCSREQFIWCWIGAQAAILLASPSKHANYLLAVLPALTLIGARPLAKGVSRIGWLNRGRLRPALLVVSTCCLAIIVLARVVPARDHRSHAARFAREVREEFPSPLKIHVYRMTRAVGGMDPIVYYLGPSTRRVSTARELDDQLQRQGTLFVVSYDKTIKELSSSYNVATVSRMNITDKNAPPKHPPLVLARVSPTLPTANRTLRPRR